MYTGQQSRRKRGDSVEPQEDAEEKRKLYLKKFLGYNGQKTEGDH